MERYKQQRCVACCLESTDGHIPVEGSCRSAVSNWQIPWVHHQEGTIQSRRTAMSCIELPSSWQFWTQTFQLSKALVHGQVFYLIGGIWQVRTIRSGRNACCRTVGDCCNHVWNVRSTKGFLTSLVPTIRHSEGCELGDPCKWWDYVHDVDSTSPWLGACRGSRADLQDGTHDVGCGIGHLVEAEGLWILSGLFLFVAFRSQNCPRRWKVGRCLAALGLVLLVLGTSSINSMTSSNSMPWVYLARLPRCGSDTLNREINVPIYFVLMRVWEQTPYIYLSIMFYHVKYVCI